MGAKKSEQISMFSLIGEWETPLLPVEQRKKDVKAWVVEVARHVKGFSFDAPTEYWLVRPRRVMFTRDARPDPRTHSGWFTAADSCDGKNFFGWYGGQQHEPIFAKKPSFSDCVHYLETQRHYDYNHEPVKAWESEMKQREDSGH